MTTRWRLLLCFLLLRLASSSANEDWGANSVETPNLLANHSELFELPSVAGDRHHNYTFHARDLRQQLLSAYDSVLPPPGDGILRDTNFGTPTQASTQVEITIQFMKTLSVDASKQRMSVSVWFVLEWTDARLAWDPGDFGGISYSYFRATALTDSESTEIWVPDIVGANLNPGLARTLEPALVVVYGGLGGRAFWKRKGTLDVDCSFRHLANFPFDSESAVAHGS